jgi:hypothetical protein
MKEIFQSLESPFAMMVLIVLIGCLVPVVGAITTAIGKYASHHADLQFKRELVERGLSVEEIERVIAAKSTTTAKDNES